MSSQGILDVDSAEEQGVSVDKGYQQPGLHSGS